MKIKNIKESQNGQWQCNVTTKDSHGGYSVDVAKIKLVVAIAPVEVYLKVNGGDPIAGTYVFKGDSDLETCMKYFALPERLT